MKQQQTNQIEKIVSRRITSGRLRRVVALLSAFVLFTTMNTLKFNADTLERIPTCGIEQHIHSDDCYDIGGTLVCGLAEHVHTDACFQQRPSASTRIDEYVPLNAQVNLATSGVLYSAGDEVGTSPVDADVAEADGELGTAAVAEAAAAKEDDVFSTDEDSYVDVEDEAFVTELQVEDAAPVEEKAEPAAEKDAPADAEETPAVVEDEVKAEAPVAEEEVVAEELADEENAPADEAEAVTVEYEYEIGDQAEVLLSAVLEALELEAGEISEVGIARNDETRVTVTANEDGDYVIAPLASFLKTEIVVIAADGDYVIALTNAVVEEKTEETEQTEEAETEEAAAEVETTEETVEESTVEADAADDTIIKEETAQEETAEEAVEAETEAETTEEVTEAEEETTEETAETETEEETTEEENTEEEAEVKEEVTEEPAETEEVTEETVTEEPAKDEEATEETVTEEPAKTEEATEETVTEEPAEEGAAAEEITEEPTEEPAETIEATEPEARAIALDFTDYIATDEHTTYLYEAAEVVVLVNANEISATDGVAITGEVEPAEEGATLVISDNGEYILNGVTYTVTGLVLPEKSVTNADETVTIATANEEATLLNVEPIFEETAENYADIFSLFQAAESDPSLLASIANVVFGVAYAEEDARELQMKLFNIGLVDERGEETEPGTAVHVQTSFDGIVGQDFALYHIVDGKPVLVEDAVLTDDEGRAVGFDFYVDSLSPFALVYYTVINETGETYTGYSLKTDERALSAQAILETLGIQAIATGVTAEDEGVEIDGLSIALPEDFTKATVVIEAGLDTYEVTLLATDELAAVAGDYAVALDLSASGLDDSVNYKVTVEQKPATEEQVAAVEAALSDPENNMIAHVSNLEMVDISIVNIETGEAVEPAGPVSVSLTKAGEAVPTVVHFKDDHTTEVLEVAEDGSFTTESFSEFTGSYTVEYTTTNNVIEVKVDFTDIVQNGVDFDANDVITALNDGVGIKIDELEKGYSSEGSDVVYGELYIDYTTADNKDYVVQKSWGSLDVVSADEGLSVENGEIRVTADGKVVLSDGETTINIVISNYSRLLAEELSSQGVDITVLEGSVPAGSKVEFTDHTEEQTQALISEYNIEATENTGSFDVSIAMPEGGAFTEEGAFKVTVDAPAVEVPEGAVAKYKVYHIHDGDVESLEASVEDGKMAFVTGSFSDFVYTVDFEYTDPETGEKIAWKFPGDGSYRISDIMLVLGVTGKIGQVDLLRSVDEGGSEKVLYLEEKEGDLYLTSEEAFTDTFVLTVEVEGSLYIITVTDDNINTSTNLNDFLADITFSETFEKDDDNKDIVKEGRTYHMHLTFTEIGNSQFATTGLTYTVPAGIKMSQTSGNFTIRYNGTDYGGNSYSYDESTNTITVTFDDTVKNLVAISADAQFTIDIAGEFVQQKDSYVFGNDHTKNFVLDNNHDTSIEKSGSYNSGDNKVHYTVTAKSDGKSENVVITDIVDGTALTYDQGSIQIYGNSTTPEINENADGFVVTLPSMSDGETVTINYTASVDFGNLTGKGTVSQTGNTVKIKADDDPEIEKPTNISNTIDYNPLQKSHGDVISDGNTKTVPWTITVNQQQLKSMSGTEITDTIGYNSRDYMSYSGSGISITVVDGDYTVASYTRDWSSLNLTTNSNGQETWTFKIPESGEPDYHDDADNTYKYVITYTTEVDASGKVANFDVSNDVHDDENHQGSNSTQVTPGTDGITLVKENKGYSAATSDWEISFNVPQSGLSSAVVTDTLPNNGTYWDTLLGDVLITGLFDDESYTIDTSDPKKVVITFYKSTEKTDENKGLKSSSSDRTIKVTLKTNNNSDWVIANSGDDHWNYAELSANGQVITDKDKSNPRSEGVSKTGSNYGTKEINGRQYPIFKYVVNFYGISDGSFSSDILTFTDDYDQTYLELYNDPSDGTDLCIRDRYNNGGTNSGEVSYSDNNGVLTFTANKNQFYVDGNGIYTSTYQMYYYLIVKQDAEHTYLNALETASVGAVANEYYVPINNRVDWGTFNDSVTIDYKYPAVDKTAVEIDASNRTAKYEIVLNPDKLSLNGGEAMELQDSAENLSIDYSTIVITVEPAENASQVTYYYRGNTGYYNIPDATKVTIRYSARIIGDGAVTFSNDASMKGYRDSTTNKETVSSSASGSLNIEWAMIYKHAYRKMDRPLNGAEYVLTDRNGNPVLYPANAQTFTDVNGVDVKAGDPVIFRTHRMDVNDTPDGQGTRAGKRTADERDGYAWIFLDKDKTGLALQKGITYYFKEYKAPTGYQKDDTIFSFTIAEHPDYDDYEYYKGDILRIADSPVDGVLEIDKTFVGTHNLTDTQKKNITFEITAVDDNGDALEFPYTKNESGEYVTTTKLEITYADFENGVYKLDALPYGIYTVKETNHALGGYIWQSTTYKVDEVTESNAEYSGTVDIKAGSKEHKIAYTNTYEPQKRSVNIVKKNAEKTIYLYGATFQVFKKNAGTGDYEVYQDDHLTSDGKFTIDFESRTTGVTLTNLDLGEYKIVETVAPTDYVLDSTPVYFTVTASDVTAGAGSDTNGSNVLSFANEGGLPTFAIKNEIDHTYTLTKVDALRLRKKLNGAQFTVYEVTAASGGVVTLSDTAVAGPFTTDENGRAVIDAKTGYDPAKLYAVVETKAPAGYKVSDEKYFFYTGATPPSLAATVKTFDSTTVVDLHDGPKESTVPNEEDRTKLLVKKQWYKVDGNKISDDNTDFDGIEIKLYQVQKIEGGDVIRTVRYPDENTTFMMDRTYNGNWLSYYFDDLPTGNSVNTEQPLVYNYYVEEVVPEGYIATYVLDSTSSQNPEEVVAAAEGTIEVRNSPKPISHSVKKVWLDDGQGRPGSITVTLYYIDSKGNVVEPNNDELGGLARDQSLSASNNWSFTWPTLNPGTADNPRTYYVKEYNGSISGYVTRYQENEDNTETIITNAKTTSDKLKVKKVWLNEDGSEMSEDEMAANHAEPVTVQLQKEEGTPGDTVNVTIKLNYHDKGSYYQWNSDTHQNDLIDYDNGWVVRDITTQAVGKNGEITINTYSVNGAITVESPIGQGTMTEAYGTYTYTLGSIGVDTDIILKAVEGNPTPQVASYSQASVLWSGTVTDVTTSDGIKKNGSDLTASDIRVTLDSSNNWMYNWETLTAPDGHTYRYSVREVNVPAGFDVSYENNDGIQTGLIFVKNAVSQYTRATAKKEWQDSTGAIIAAPSEASVVYTLYQDGKKTSQTVTLDGTVDENGEFNAWEATFEGLEKKKANGEPHVYTVKETVGHTGYVALDDTAANGGTIINKEVRSLTAIKKWLNASGEEFDPPVGVTSVTVVLYKDGVATDKSVTLDGRPDNNGEEHAWVATFNSLDNDGTYTVGETNVTSGYTQYGDIKYVLANNTVSSTGITAPNSGTATITNKKSETGSVKVTKSFSGVASLPDGFKITATWNDGTAHTEELTTSTSGMTGDGSAASPYTWTISDLPLGTEVTFEESGYTVDGYSVSTTINGKATASATADDYKATAVAEPTAVPFVNTYTRDTGALKINKSVTVNGGTIANTTLVDGDYTFTITGSGTAAGNSATVKINILNGAVHTVGLDGTPEPSTVTVVKDGTDAKVENLPTGVYTVAEVTTGLAEKGISLTGTNDQSITVEKDQIERIPTASFVNNKDVGDLSISKTVKPATSTQEFTFTVTFANPADKTLVKQGDTFATSKTVGSTTTTGTTTALNASLQTTVTLKGGETITIKDIPADVTYTVEETPVANYEQTAKQGDSGTISKTTPASASFTNRELTTVTVTKAWSNADGTTTAPDNAYVTFDLYAGGTKQDGKSVKLNGAADKTEDHTKEADGTTASGNTANAYESVAWTATWINLPKVDDHDQVIEYTVKEALTNSEGWAGYKVSYPDNGESATTGQIITNTQTPAKATPEVTKVFTNGNGHWPKDGETETGFAFTLAGPYESNLTADHADKEQVVMGVTSVTIKSTDAGLKQAFGEITFKKAGTYYFTIKETVPGDATNASGVKYSVAADKTGAFKLDGITYDATPYSVVVNVTNTNGKLAIESGYPKYDGEKGSLTVTNSYSTEGEIPFSAKKNFTDGKNTVAQTAGQFSFTLTETDSSWETLKTSDESPVAKLQETKETKNTNGEVDFTSIALTNDDVGKTRYFTIAEVIPDGATDENSYTVNGIRYDPTVHKIKVEIADDGNGGMTVTKTDMTNAEPATGTLITTGQDAVFTNTKLTEISATKTWVSIDNQTVNPAEVTLTLTLTRYIVGTSIVADTASDAVKSVSFTTDSNGKITKTVDDVQTEIILPDATNTDYGEKYAAAWSYKWENLPLYNEDGTEEYTYMVTETWTGNYSQDSSKGVIYRKDGEQEFKNVEVTSYTLPSTGGMGTGIFYGTGLSLMLFAFLGFVLNARKRRRGEGI